MKNNLIHNIFTWLLTLSLSMFVSCSSQDEYGIYKIYMPQAVMYNGGQTNEYPVPMPNLPMDNYRIDDNGMLHVVLGVYRSGEGDLSAYQVEVFVDEAATAQAVASTNRGVALPLELCSLPETVSVPDGDRQETFNLTIDLPQLIEEYPEYNKNRMIIVVGIRNPSKWELNEALSRTTVIIEGNTFLPVIPILKNGDFGPGSSENWTIVNINDKPFELMKIDEEKGELQIGVDDYSQYGGDSRFMCYQKLDSPDLEIGQTYVMSAMINIPAQDFYMSDDKNNLKREMDLGFALFPNTTNMTSQSDYKPSGDAKFWYMDVTMDNGKGKYPLLTGTSGFESFSSIHLNKRPDSMGSGEFTMDADHMGGYIVFYVRLRNTCPSVKTISITDVSIVAK